MLQYSILSSTVPGSPHVCHMMPSHSGTDVQSQSANLVQRSMPARQSDPGTEGWRLPSMMARGRTRLSEPGEGAFSGPFMRPLAPMPPLDGSVLQLRGLPYTATAPDVAQFFAGPLFATCRATPALSCVLLPHISPAD